MKYTKQEIESTKKILNLDRDPEEIEIIFCKKLIENFNQHIWDFLGGVKNVKLKKD